MSATILDFRRRENGWGSSTFVVSAASSRCLCVIGDGRPRELAGVCVIRGPVVPLRDHVIRYPRSLVGGP